MFQWLSTFFAAEEPAPQEWMPYLTSLFWESIDAAGSEFGLLFHITLHIIWWAMRILVIAKALSYVFGVKIALSSFGLGTGNSNQNGSSSGHDKLGAIQVSDVSKTSRTRLKDVAGCDEIVEEIRQVIDQIKTPEKYSAYGAHPLRGVLLDGAAGIGKTLIARAIAGEAGLPFFTASGASFDNRYVGVGASNVRLLFETARKAAPSIIFIDEIDAIGKSRDGENRGGTSDTLNQLLVEMDGFETCVAESTETGASSTKKKPAYKPVFVIGATNMRASLDKALLRAGRFDRHISIGKPDRKAREAIFRLHLAPLKLSEQDFTDRAQAAKRLAVLTTGYSGAEIFGCCNEAAIVAVQRGRGHIGERDFKQALERIETGVEKRDSAARYTPDEKRAVALHEAGHAVAGWFSAYAPTLTKVTIIGRHSGILGFASFLPDDSVLEYHETYVDRLTVLLAGRAAEEVLFGRVSSGAADDLEKASKLARAMVLKLGLCQEAGQVVFGDKDMQFVSEETRAFMDRQVRLYIERAYKTAKELVQEKRALVESVAAKLIEDESIEHRMLVRLLGEKPNPSIGYKQYLTTLDAAVQ